MNWMKTPRWCHSHFLLLQLVKSEKNQQHLDPSLPSPHSLLVCLSIIFWCLSLCWFLRGFGKGGGNASADRGNKISARTTIKSVSHSVSLFSKQDVHVHTHHHNHRHHHCLTATSLLKHPPLSVSAAVVVSSPWWFNNFLLKEETVI